MKHPEIALDLDGVVVDFFRKLVEVYNYRYQKNLTLSDLDRGLDSLDPELVAIFNEPDWFINLDPIPNAIALASQFNDLGYRVTICTAPARNLDGLINGRTAAEKFDWIRKWLPFWSNDVIITKHKELVKADILVDDAPYNISAWCERHPEGIGVLVDQPWNKSWKQYPQNAIRGRLADIPWLIENYWCFERAKFVYRLKELEQWRK